MLDKELDKLRDKTLSFGCVIFEKSWWDVNYHRITTAKKQDNLEYTCECWWYEIFDISEYNIIWHPLTRWRIDHLDDNIENIDSYNICRYIWARLRESHLLDKTEIERMQHEKRPELKELLVLVSNYI